MRRYISRFVIRNAKKLEQMIVSPDAQTVRTTLISIACGISSIVSTVLMLLSVSPFGKSDRPFAASAASEKV